MKKILKITFLIVLFITGMTCIKASAQTAEVEQLLLDVEKLAQFKQILSDMKKGYTVISHGYNTIKNLSEGNFNLHKTFLDGLMQVSPAVRKYQRVADIINDQVILMKEYKSAFGHFKRNRNFNAKELEYISHVYDHLIHQSLDNLNQLLMVVTAGKLRMSDNERLEAIDRIYADMQDKLQFLRHFNNNTSLLSLQRAKERHDAQTLQDIYGQKK